MARCRESVWVSAHHDPHFACSPDLQASRRQRRQLVSCDDTMRTPSKIARKLGQSCVACDVRCTHPSLIACQPANLDARSCRSVKRVELTERARLLQLVVPTPSDPFGGLGRLHLFAEKKTSSQPPGTVNHPCLATLSRRPTWRPLAVTWPRYEPGLIMI